MIALCRNHAIIAGIGLFYVLYAMYYSGVTVITKHLNITSTTNRGGEKVHMWTSLVLQFFHRLCYLFVTLI